MPNHSIIVAFTLALPGLALATPTAPKAGPKALERSYGALYAGVVHPGRPSYDHMGGDEGRLVAQRSGNKFVLGAGGVHVNFVDPTARQNGVVSIHLGANPKPLEAGDTKIDPQAAIAYRTVLESAQSGGFDAVPMKRAPARLQQMTKLSLPDSVHAGAGAYGTNVVIHNELFVDYKTNTVYGRRTSGDQPATYVKVGAPLQFAK